MKRFAKGIVALLLIISIFSMLASAASAATTVAIGLTNYTAGWGSLSYNKSSKVFTASTVGVTSAYTAYVENVKIRAVGKTGVTTSHNLANKSKANGAAITTLSEVYGVLLPTTGFHRVVSGKTYTASTSWVTAILP